MRHISKSTFFQFLSLRLICVCLFVIFVDFRGASEGPFLFQKTLFSASLLLWFVVFLLLFFFLLLLLSPSFENSESVQWTKNITPNVVPSRQKHLMFASLSLTFNVFSKAPSWVRPPVYPPKCVLWMIFDFLRVSKAILEATCSTKKAPNLCPHPTGPSLEPT